MDTVNPGTMSSVQPEGRDVVEDSLPGPSGARMEGSRRRSEYTPAALSERLPRGSSNQRYSRLSYNSARSKASTNEIALRKKQLELRAAEERARVRRAILEERERMETELVNKRLEAELAELDCEERCVSACRRNSSVSSRQPDMSHVSEWVNESFRQAKDAEKITHTDRERRELRSELAESSSTPIHGQRSDNISRLAGMITQSLNVIRDSSATDTKVLMSRLSTMRDLPTFNGDTLEWLRFKKAFELTTNVGCYTEQENISRLDKALIGEAREAVASLMLTATDVGQIMGTLQLRFGNPDVIVTKIVSEVRRIPKLSSGRVDLATLATKVKNYVAALEAVDNTGHLNNPELVQNIIAKMPSAMIYQYNRFVAQSESREARLLVISKFLMNEAEMACKAGTSNIAVDKRKRADTNQNEEIPKKRGRRDLPSHKFGEHVYTTTQDSAAAVRSRKDATQNSCIFCTNGKHVR